MSKNETKQQRRMRVQPLDQHAAYRLKDKIADLKEQARRCDDDHPLKVNFYKEATKILKDEGFQLPESDIQSWWNSQVSNVRRKFHSGHTSTPLCLKILDSVGESHLRRQWEARDREQAAGNRVWRKNILKLIDRDKGVPKDDARFWKQIESQLTSQQVVLPPDGCQHFWKELVATSLARAKKKQLPPTDEDELILKYSHNHSKLAAWRAHFNMPAKENRSPKSSSHRSSDGRQRRSPSPPAESPSRKTRSPSRKTGSPSRKTGSLSRKTGSPSRKSRSPSRKTRSPSKKSRSPSRKTGSPSRKTRSPSRKTGSLSRKSRSPSRKTRSPSRKSRSPSRKTGSRSRSPEKPRYSSSYRQPREERRYSSYSRSQSRSPAKRPSSYSSKYSRTRSYSKSPSSSRKSSKTRRKYSKSPRRRSPSSGSSRSNRSRSRTSRVPFKEISADINVSHYTGEESRMSTAGVFSQKYSDPENSPRERTLDEQVDDLLGENDYEDDDDEGDYDDDDDDANDEDEDDKEVEERPGCNVAIKEMEKRFKVTRQNIVDAAECGTIVNSCAVDIKKRLVDMGLALVKLADNQK